jgi:hypothetical protein
VVRLKLLQNAIEVKSQTVLEGKVMGIRYRKSINLGGGFKINLSKSGIGYSWGTKGYRVTKTARDTNRRTYSIPGTGISYVDETGKGGRNRKQDSSQRINQTEKTQPLQEQVQQYADTQMLERAIESADISKFKEGEEGTVSEALERTIRLNWIGNILLWGLLLCPASPSLWLIPVVGVVLKIAAHTVGRVELEYSLDPEKEDEHTRRIDAWQLLAEGDKEWQVLSEQYNSNSKVNAGTGKLLKRVSCKIQKGHPYYIKTNVDTIQIALHSKEYLIILPDKVFFVRKRKVGMIDHSDFKISISSVRFVETDPVPNDAQVVDYTWQYVNKNGTSDRRFKNNRQIPVCLYGQVFLSSSSGLNVELQISSIQNTRDFEDLVK